MSEAPASTPVRTPARLGGHPGELARADDGTLVWHGDLSPDLLTDLMRAGSEGSVRVQPEPGPGRPAVDGPVWIGRCWFDLDRGRMIVHLRDRSMMA